MTQKQQQNDPLEHPVHGAFEKITGILMQLDPVRWLQLLQLLQHYIPNELERRGVVPNETPLPIAGDTRLQKRVLH